jgi:four helix bundle protein
MLFRDLKAYQHARRVALLSRPLINRLPESERDLADQWRRASNSIALNLAEGVSRRGAKEFRRFEELIAARDECARTVYGLLRKLSTAATAS